MAPQGVTGSGCSNHAGDVGHDTDHPRIFFQAGLHLGDGNPCGNGNQEFGLAKPLRNTPEDRRDLRRFDRENDDIGKFTNHAVVRSDLDAGFLREGLVR